MLGRGGLYNTPVRSCVSLCLRSSEKDSPVIHVFDGHGDNKEIALLDSLHSAPLTFMEVRQHNVYGGIVHGGVYM